jgi:hypothetical protein
MSIFVRQGKEALQEEQKTDRKEILKYLKSGDSIKVAVLGLDFGEYLQHGDYYLSSNFGVYSMPCLKHSGQEDLFDKAIPLMYDDSEKLKAQGKEDEAEAMRRIANGLRAKKRMMFGFVDLSTGNQIVVDLSRTQGEAIANSILDYEEDLENIPFVLSKKGTGTSTTVTLQPIINLDKGLNDTERNNFEQAKGTKFNHELFEKVFFTKSREQQIQDLMKIGFDVTRIGEKPLDNDESIEDSKNNKSVELSDDDLPF